MEREDGVSVCTDKAADAHRARVSTVCIQTCDLWGANGRVHDSQSAYIHQSRAAEKRAGRCAMTTAGQPRPSSSAEGEAAGTRGSQGAGGKPFREPARASRREAMAGRRALRQENMAGRVPAHRGAPDAGGGAAGAERGAHPAPSTGADRSPAGRQTGRGRRRASSARDGTARPGRPERLPAAARDTRGEDGAHPAAAPLTLRWEPPPRPWRRRGGRELTAAEGRRWPAAQRGTARRRRHRPSRAPPSLYSLPPARPPLRQPRGAAHSPERRRTRPGSGRSAAGAEHGFPHTGAGPGPCPAARPPLEHGSCGQDPDPGMAAQVAPLQNGNKLTWPSCSFKSETLVLLTAV